MEAVHYNGKVGFPSTAYEVTVDHIGRVLGVTAGLLGAKNNKTMIRFVKLITKIRSKDHAKSGVCHRGWRISQGMKADWLWNSCWCFYEAVFHTIEVYLRNNSRYWLTLEASAHKDVERFFGRIKSRSRILKLPLQFHTREAVDKIFITCFILQNMLHAWDGHDQ
ncbi:unnamed protein product, partial [Discosporangium mesarthrocarpum]